MFTVTKLNHFFTCSSLYDLSLLSDNPNVKQVCRVSPTGQSIQTWVPGGALPSFSSLTPGGTYYLKSNVASYSIDLTTTSATQNSTIVAKYQFFTYTGASAYSLASLPNKSNIIKIYKTSTNGLSLQSWTPSASFPPFSTFATGTTYMIVSSAGPYDLFS